MNVSKIEITSTNNTWIQIVELIATETGIDTNAALAGKLGFCAARRKSKKKQ
jgi:hypothetical protein